MGAENNKPRTAKIGAISKAQNCKKWDPSGFVELQLVAKYEKNLKGDRLGTRKNFPKNEIFEQCHSPKNVKGGTLWDFLTSIVLQNIETNEGGTLWCNPKSFKKSRIVPKKSGILSVISKF